MNNLKYKCLWCEFESIQIRGLKNHIYVKHNAKIYNNKHANNILSNRKTLNTNEEKLIAAVSYKPRHTNKNKVVRQIAIDIITKNLSIQVKREKPTHFV